MNLGFNLLVGHAPHLMIFVAKFFQTDRNNL